MSAPANLPPEVALTLAGVALVVGFAAREVLGGALRAAGADLWGWAERRTARRGRPGGGVRADAAK